MIRIFSTDEIEQGSDLWHDMRNRYATGTDAYDLLRGKTVDEVLAKKQASTFRGNYYTRRGHILEDEAKSLYSELYQPVENAGFVTNSKYPRAGVSPDGLVGEDGLVECKAFNEKRHLKVYESLDPHIIAQVQFQLFVTERKWCDLVLFNPDIDPDKAFLTRRLEPDPVIQNNLRKIFA